MQAQSMCEELASIPVKRRRIVTTKVKDAFTEAVEHFFTNAVLRYVPNQAWYPDSSYDIWDPSWSPRSLYHDLELAVKTTASHNIANQQQYIFG